MLTPDINSRILELHYLGARGVGPAGRHPGQGISRPRRMRRFGLALRRRSGKR